MTTQYLEAMPADETLERAKKVSFARFLKTVWFGFWYLAGWVPGRIWVGVVYSAFAVEEGWRDGAGKPRRELPKHAKEPGT